MIRCRRCQATQSRPKPPQCDLKATPKPVDSHPIGTSRPPQGHLKATPKPPSGRSRDEYQPSASKVARCASLGLPGGLRENCGTEAARFVAVLGVRARRPFGAGSGWRYPKLGGLGEIEQWGWEAALDGRSVWRERPRVGIEPQPGSGSGGLGRGSRGIGLGIVQPTSRTMSWPPNGLGTRTVHAGSSHHSPSTMKR